MFTVRRMYQLFISFCAPQVAWPTVTKLCHIFVLPNLYKVLQKCESLFPNNYHQKTPNYRRDFRLYFARISPKRITRCRGRVNPGMQAFIHLHGSVQSGHLSVCICIRAVIISYMHRPQSEGLVWLIGVWYIGMLHRGSNCSALQPMYRTNFIFNYGIP